MPDSSQGSFKDTGIFKALREGNATISVSSNGISSNTTLKVLGSVVDIYPTQKEIQVEKGNASFKIMGNDKLGYKALVEPRDISLKFDESTISVTPKSDGSFLIKALKTNFAIVVEATVADIKTHIAVINQTPINISSTTKGSKFDNNEAKLLETLLTNIYEESGKGAAYISSGTTQFTINRKNGVPYVDTGFLANPGYRIFGIQELYNNNDLLKVKITP